MYQKGYTEEWLTLVDKKCNLGDATQSSSNTEVAICCVVGSFTLGDLVPFLRGADYFEPDERISPSFNSVLVADMGAAAAVLHCRSARKSKGGCWREQAMEAWCCGGGVRPRRATPSPHQGAGKRGFIYVGSKAFVKIRANRY